MTDNNRGINPASIIYAYSTIPLTVRGTNMVLDLARIYGHFLCDSGRIPKEKDGGAPGQPL